MIKILLISQLVVALLLSLSILIQEKGEGFGEAIGGAGAGSFQTSKRGAEKVLAMISVVLVVLFLGLSLALNFI